MTQGAALGRRAEDLAAAWYEQRGWQIVDRNWRCSSGELDIVACDGETLVFCEVKARRSTLFGAPEEAVTPLKRARIRKAAGSWLGKSPGVERHGPAGSHSRRAPPFSDIRFDVVSVGPEGLKVIEAAF